MGCGEKGTKLNKDAVQNPPPGSYTVTADAGKPGTAGIVFGKEKRDKSKPDTIPGPGNYSIPSTIENRGISIKGKIEEKIIERAPGPGAYPLMMDPSKTHGGGIKFGHEPKTSAAKENNAPGPGMYKVDLPYKGGHIFGKDRRDKQKPSGSPGPGQYNTRKEEGLTYF